MFVFFHTFCWELAKYMPADENKKNSSRRNKVPISVFSSNRSKYKESSGSNMKRRRCLKFYYTNSQSMTVQDTSGCGAQRITTCSTSPWRTSWWPPSTASSHSSSWGTGQQLSSFFDFLYLPQFLFSKQYHLLFPLFTPECTCWSSSQAFLG